MPRTSFAKTSPLLAAATVAAGLIAAAAPAQAADCAQWGFPGQTTLQRSTGEFLSFNSTGPNAGGPATWNHPNGQTRNGTVSGNIDASGQVQVTFHKDNNNWRSTGQVEPNGVASGVDPDNTNVTWRSSNLMTCVQQAAPKEGPGVSFDLVVGGLVAHITDRSGVDSQCQYQADFYSRAFFLPKNSTVDLRIVPAIPEFRDWPVSVTCDNGTRTDTSTFF